MKRINPNLHPLPHVMVLGIPALITPYKVSRDTVHLGLYCYELKSRDTAGKYPVIIAEEVDDGDCLGTILTLAPMLMEQVHQLILLPGELERMYFER